MKIENNVSLQPFNTFRIHAKAKYFVALKNTKDLQSILIDNAWRSIPKFILGGGSNILLTQQIMTDNYSNDNWL